MLNMFASSSLLKTFSKILVFALIINVPGWNPAALAEEPLQTGRTGRISEKPAVAAIDAATAYQPGSSSKQDKSLIGSIMAADNALSARVQKARQTAAIQKQQFVVKEQGGKAAEVRKSMEIIKKAEAVKVQSKPVAEKIKAKEPNGTLPSRNEDAGEPLVEKKKPAENLLGPPKDPSSPAERHYISGKVISNNHHTPSMVMHGEVLIETPDGRFYVKFEDEEAIKLVEGTYVKAEIYRPSYRLEGVDIFKGKVITAEMPGSGDGGGQLPLAEEKSGIPSGGERGPQDPKPGQQIPIKPFLNYPYTFRGGQPEESLIVESHSGVVSELQRLIGPGVKVNEELPQGQHALIVASDGNVPPEMTGSLIRIQIQTVEVVINEMGEEVAVVTVLGTVSAAEQFFAKTQPVDAVRFEAGGALRPGMKIEVRLQFIRIDN
jgi:hypothetical protein